MGLFRETGLLMNPTFIAFMPWTTRAGYVDLLATIRSLDLIDHVSPVQLAIRLLITNNSRLLELEDVRSLVRHYDLAALAWIWSHPDPDVDRLARDALVIVNRGAKSGRTRREIFADLWELASGERLPEVTGLLPRATIPYLNEPWYC